MLQNKSKNLMSPNQKIIYPSGLNKCRKIPEYLEQLYCKLYENNPSYAIEKYAMRSIQEGKYSIYGVKIG